MSKTQRKLELISQKKEEERKQREEELEKIHKDVFDKIDEWFENGEEILTLGPYPRQIASNIKALIFQKYVGEKLNVSFEVPFVSGGKSDMANFNILVRIFEVRVDNNNNNKEEKPRVDNKEKVRVGADRGPKKNKKKYEPKQSRKNN
jgi:hypothetical protein